MPPSYWNSTAAPSPRSSVSVIFRPRVRKAVSRRRCSRRREVVVERLEDLGVGQERDRRAGARLVGLALLRARPAARRARSPASRREAVAADLDVQRLGQRVDDRDADAVQAAGDLVAAAVAELAAGVQDGEHDLDGRLSLLLHDRDGDAAAVVGDGDRVVRVDRRRRPASSGRRAPRRRSCRRPRRRGGAGRARRSSRCTCPGACARPRGPRGR